MTEKMVLSTSLLIAYENVAFDNRRYQKVYRRLMKIISLPYKTNKKQLLEAQSQGLDNSVVNRLLPQMQHLSERDDSLEVLASKTRFKIILTDDEHATLPHVYYRSSFMSNEITIALKSTDSRSDLIKYLQMLCATATRVTICDNYLAQSWDNTQRLFRAVFPRSKLEIHFVETSTNLTSVVKNSTKVTDDFVKSIHNDWTVSESTLYKDSHDRYLMIETPQGNIEVMISSGFDHIWKASPKEITCIIREKE
ncbi:hypothetical protein [Photobacterium leiognathi]|uniref:Uncharacterized protein n=1 Tax=Photobacterium leiognathi TaxID=553611 RepID=A0A2T3M7K2_PHOLE|nr:hypothetical protein [Photobacterium leiognathi]KJF97405.1 hypothetical protein UB34_12825 [Photobacterium leiognathi]PSV88264.1 hypothetical protein CTM89_14905 [Photobacterium leiognathi]